MPYKIRDRRWLYAALLFVLVTAACTAETMGEAERRTASGTEPVKPAEPVKGERLQPAEPVSCDKPEPAKPVEPAGSAASSAQQVRIATGAAPTAPEGGAIPASAMDERQLAEKYDVVEVTATSYYAGVESTGKHPGHPEYGITYSGVKVHRDEHSLSTIAADLDVFPLGTVLWIPGYGYGVVTDTGSAIKGRIIDLYFNTKDEIYDQWGKRTLDVYIVEEGTGVMTQDMFMQKADAYKS